MGVEGNEAVDVAAKEALGGEKVDVNVTMGISEYHRIIKEEIAGRWQKEWEGEKRGMFYYIIQNTVSGENIT